MRNIPTGRYIPTETSGVRHVDAMSHHPVNQIELTWDEDRMDMSVAAETVTTHQIMI